MRRLGIALLLSASTLAASAGLAQTPADNAPAAPAATAPAATAPEANNGVGDIVVTAQRRSQNLLSVPLSISAATGQQLNNTGIRQISSLQYTNPGLVVQNGVGYTQVYIRGVGNNIFVGADPSVATFIDDVPRIYGSSVNNFFNVERVEVLKGAQGGLYGRNATGGVINIITKQPSDRPSAEARVLYGEKHTLKAAAYVNVPLSDHLAWNISAERDSHAPYVKNLASRNPLTAANFPSGTVGGVSPIICGAAACTGQQVANFFNSAVNPSGGYGNQDFWALDSKLRVRFSDSFKITFDGDYSKKHDSEGNQWFLTSPGYTTLVASGLFSSFGIPNNGFPGLWQPVTKKFTTYNSTPAAANLVDYGGSAKAELSLPGVDITNIFAYRAQHSLYQQNYADPITLDVPIVKNNKWYWYEELRAVSTGPGPFHFLGGATYLRDHFHGRTTNLLIPPIGVADTFTESTDDVRNWSIYGQVGYDLTDKLNLTVSGRYIHESNKAVFRPTTTGLSAPSPAAVTVHKFLPSATLSYKLAGGGNIYARYAKGFKSGGINPVVPPALFKGNPLGLIFGPEQVDTYEVGFKDSFMDRKLAVTADVFYNNYKGLQTTTTGQDPALILAIINAGTARSYGAEGSITWRVAKPLTLSGNIGYLNAKYKNFGNSDGSVLHVFDFSHETMLFSPTWQGSIGVDLDQPISDNYRLVGNILASYTSKTRAGLSTNASGLPNTGDPIIPAYWLTNLRLGVRTTDDHVGLYLVVTNLFNKGYYTFGSTGGLGNNFVWGDPRIISGEVQIKF